MGMNEIEALRQQQDVIQDQIVAIDQGQKIGDRQALQDELNAIGNKISELEYAAKLQAQTEQIEVAYTERVEASTNEIAYLIDNLDFGVPAKELFINFTEEKAIASYEYMRSAIQAAVVEREKVYLLKVKEAEEKEAALETENAKLQDRIAKLQSEKAELTLELSNTKIALEDAESKRDVAYNLLEEANKEVDRLNSYNDDLHKQIAVGASAASKVVDVQEARERFFEERAKEEQAKPAIYNKRWEDDLKKNAYLAELAETGATIKIKWTEINKYREVTAEQAETFRTEASQGTEVETGSAGILEVEEQPVVPQFQDEADTTAVGVVEDVPAAQVAAKTVEERLQALEQAVFGH